MANSAQAKKRGRQIERRTEVNKARKSRIRTFLKKVDEALETGEEKLALDALKNAQPELMRGVSKGLMHKNTAARKMSRLSSRGKSLSKK